MYNLQTVEGPIAQAETLIRNEGQSLQLNSIPLDFGEMEQPLPSPQKPWQL